MTFSSEAKTYEDFEKEIKRILSKSDHVPDTIFVGLYLYHLICTSDFYDIETSVLEHGDLYLNVVFDAKRRSRVFNIILFQYP